MKETKQKLITLPMTSDNSNGQIVSSSTGLPNLYRNYNEGGFRVRNRIVSGSKSGHTTIQLSEPKIANKILLSFHPTYYPRTFHIQGSNDGVLFDNLITVEDNTEIELDIAFDNRVEYKYYRLKSVDAPYNYLELGQINFYKTYVEYNDKVLLSSGEKVFKINKTTPDSDNMDQLGLIPMDESNLALDRKSDTFVRTSEVNYSFKDVQAVDFVSVWLTTGNQVYRQWRTFSLLGSNDGTNYENIFTKNMGDIASTDGHLFIELDKPYYYKHYRTKGTANSTSFGGTLQVNSFQLYLQTNILTSLDSEPETAISNGISPQELSKIDFSTDFTEKHYINNQSTPLGLGKVFAQPLDMDKVVKRVSIK